MIKLAKKYPDIALLLMIMLIVLIVVLVNNAQLQCEDGDELRGKSCITENSFKATPIYKCSISQQTLIGDKCCSSDGRCLDARVDYYTCSSGYLEGHSCIVETVYEPY